MRKNAIKTAIVSAVLMSFLIVSPAKNVKADYPPGVMFSTVLNGVKLIDKDGQFRLDNIQAVFLPADVNEGWIILRKKDKTELFRFDWKPDRLKPPYSLISITRMTDLRTKQSLYGSVDMGHPGDYVLDFYLPSGKFYTFPFTISKISSPDPFAGGDLYFIDGDWSKWGYLYYSDAKPENNIQWKVWLRNKAHEREKDVKIRVEIIRDKDKKLICTSRENMTHTLRPSWNRFAFDLIFPMEDTSDGAYFKAKDLVGTDGNYTLNMTIDGSLYGSWKLTVKGGKPVYKGRTERGKADKLTFIEGGVDAFWYSM